MRVLSIMVAAALPVAAQAQVAAPVTLTADDGVRIAGDYYRAPHPKAVILLFHQAGSSKAEYRTIAPRLVAAGYSALAIDQRAGGSLYSPNQTVARLGRSADYLAARRDLDAALAWGVKQGAPVILWGSSYSAALVFLVAAAHPAEVKAVLAFSPGEYLGSTSVKAAATRITAPLFVTSASERGEIAAARLLADASPSRDKRDYVPAHGIHGASTLIAAKNPSGQAANWAAVLSFLKTVAP